MGDRRTRSGDGKVVQWIGKRETAWTCTGWRLSKRAFGAAGIPHGDTQAGAYVSRVLANIRKEER